MVMKKFIIDPISKGGDTMARIVIDGVIYDSTDDDQDEPEDACCDKREPKAAEEALGSFTSITTQTVDCIISLWQSL